MNICPDNKCTGCFACAASCPQKCISMQENKYGELHPVVEEEKCVQCGLCQKICPNNNPLVFNYPHACYASWITDSKKRRICASGGIGTIMSEYVIENCNGVVFGSRYNERMSPVMTYAENIEELEYYKGSRYVQSIFIVETYNQIKTFLKSGRKVLFIGTPCQVAGLKGFLREEWDNLITVDLICHGCTPTRYFEEELSYICSQEKITDVSDVRFRGNDGNDYAYTIWGGFSDLNGEHPKGKLNRLFYKKGCSSYYLAGFLLGATLRENCFNCIYARPERISDITIGDFIGLGKEASFDYSKRNVSSVLINTDKGKEFYDSVSEFKNELVNVERNYSERLAYKPSLIHPSERHPLNKAFKDSYLEGGYIYASRKVLATEVNIAEKSEKRKRRLRMLLLPFRVIRKIYRIIAHII